MLQLTKPSLDARAFAAEHEDVGPSRATAGVKKAVLATSVARRMIIQEIEIDKT